MRADSTQGQLESLLLGVMADGPAHGYRVIELLRERSGGAFDLPEGTVYPALHRLERAGLLASAWDTASGRRRRVYRITERGQGELTGSRERWQRFAQAVTDVLGAPAGA
jgi:PadR family transcriptional regulator